MNPSSCEHIHLNIKTIRKSFEDFLIVPRASSLLGREFQLMAKAGPLHLLSLASLEVKFQRAVRNQRSREPKKECEKIRIAEIRNVKLESTRTRNTQFRENSETWKQESAKYETREWQNIATQKLESAKCGKHGNVKTTKPESTKARNLHSRNHEKPKRLNTEARKDQSAETRKS